MLFAFQKDLLIHTFYFQGITRRSTQLEQNFALEASEDESERVMKKYKKKVAYRCEGKHILQAFSMISDFYFDKYLCIILIKKKNILQKS